MSLYNLLTNRQDCKQRIAAAAECVALAHSKLADALAALTVRLDLPKHKDT